MVNYPKMYAILCAAASDAIDLLDVGNIGEARQLLQSALLEAEALYLENTAVTDADPS